MFATRRRLIVDRDVLRGGFSPDERGRQGRGRLWPAAGLCPRGCRRFRPSRNHSHLSGSVPCGKTLSTGPTFFILSLISGPSEIFAGLAKNRVDRGEVLSLYTDIDGAAATEQRTRVVLSILSGHCLSAEKLR
jgi:hypothetical protein